MGTTGQSITLANSIIGVGILAMPFCFQQCGVLLATLILLFMGLVSRLCCHFLLKSALLARRRNFEFLAFHVFGQAGKLAVEIGIIGFLMGTCIAYFVVVGDLGPQIVAKMFNINQSDILRTSIMVIVSLVCVLPLGLLRNVDSLSNVSAATIAFYFCLVMKVIFEAGAVMMTTSDWNQRVEMWRPAGLLQCVPIFSMALFCQTQLFEIFESLPTLSLEKMNIVTKNAINICTAVYFTLGVFGYIAFSSHVISGNILMSLSPTMASDVIKLGFVMSLAFSFPLIIFPCRASLYSFLYKKVHSSHHDHIINHSIPETTFRCITVAIVAVALFISLLIPNIELVLGLAGSTIGVLICVVFPAACFIYVTFKNTNERILAKGVLVLGLVIMVLGTYANLQVAESSIEHYDDKYTQERIDKIVEDFFENRDKGDVYLKPPPSNDIQKEPPDTVVLNKERKDSEIQPPNPVPPESQSNEKITLTKNAIKTDEKDVLQVPETKESVDKVSETHPRNLKTKLESQLANGVNNGEAQKPKEDKPQSNEDKIDMLKQQKLIETIKQHGEEQKELIKEQKEILDEILKTKKELQQNKNEAVEANEAKKLAVESIKQIADMAIKSIGGVSEKPDLIKKDEKVEERLEKLTNDAVQEIAKKAVETIEAIQDIKEKPEQPNVAPPVQNIVPDVQPNVQVNPAQNVQPNQNAQPNQIVQPEIPLNPPIAEGVNLPVVRTKDEAPIVAANVDPQANSNMNQNNAAVVQNVANNNVNQNNGAVAQNNIAPNVNPQPIQEAKPVVNEMLNQNAPIPYNNVQKPPEIVKAPLNPGNDAVKHHSHSPDEPQSYKQGEDTQVKPETKIVQNVPLPIVNELANNQMKIDKKPAAQRPSDDIQVNVPPKVENNGANNANVQEMVPVANAQPQNDNPAPVRQKREIIDCSEKVLLKPEDKAICRNVVDENIKDSDVQLPNPVSLTLTRNTIKADEKEILQVSETKQSEIQLKTKLESKLANDEAQKSKEDIPQSNEDKIAMMQQKLTETIKRHGEKQKEMTEEQKKILDEILKTKNEPQQKKEAVGTKETKKIAVESIKQIADMAFKSIGGVSEKPEAKNDVKEERFEKLTNDALQDKDKKTVEHLKLLNGVSNGDDQKPSEDKPIIMEQQKHIETIKLHGEEQQKELTKVEMLKTQKQLQEVKNLASEAKEAKKKAIQSIRRNNDAYNGNLQENVPKIANPTPIEQKREVIDCTEKVSLKPEDRAICINLAHENFKNSEEMLPRNVDLNDVVLPKSLPIAANILHHISRQLKSFDKDER